MLARMDLIKRASVAFKKLDVDNSGFLEKEELIPVVKKWAETCNQEIGLDASSHLDAMISATDANSDGKIDLMEFIKNLMIFIKIETAQKIIKLSRI